MHSVSTVDGRESRSHVFLVNLSRVSTLIELVCVNESSVLIYSGCFCTKSMLRIINF